MKRNRFTRALSAVLAETRGAGFGGRREAARSQPQPVSVSRRRLVTVHHAAAMHATTIGSASALASARLGVLGVCTVHRQNSASETPLAPAIDPAVAISATDVARDQRDHASRTLAAASTPAASQRPSAVRSSAISSAGRRRGSRRRARAGLRYGLRELRAHGRGEPRRREHHRTQRSPASAEARRRFAELIDRVQRGERFVVSRHGRPAVALVPPREELARRPHSAPKGLAAGAGALADWPELVSLVDEIYAARAGAPDRPTPDLD